MEEMTNMIIHIDKYSLLDDLQMYTREIKRLEKASGYKIDALIGMFKSRTITIMDNKKRSK